MLIYLLFAFIAIVSTLFVCFICAQKGVYDTGEKFKIYKPCEDEDFVPFKGKALILITIICFICSLIMQISLYINTSAVNFVKLYGLFLIVFTAGVIDYKRKIIPNILIVMGLVYRLGIYVYEFFAVDDIKAVLINDLIGFCIGFVFLALVSLITRGALGFGDVKLFGIIGLTGGSFCTYSVLLVSLVVSAVVSIVNLARKKMGRRDSFPFGPCIAIGLFIVLLLGSY